MLQRLVEPGQYTSDAFAAACAKLKITQSMGRVGCALDNAAAESFFSTLQHELISRRRWRNPRPSPPRHRRLDRHLVQQKTAPLHQQHDQPNRLRTSQRSLNQPSTIRGEAQAVLVPLIGVAALWFLGHPTLAIIVAAIALTITVASAVSPEIRTRLDRIMAFVGHWAGRFLTFFLLGIVQLVIFAPAAMWSRFTRSDPLDVSSHNDETSQWLPRSPQKRSLHQRPYTDERYRRPSTGTAARPGSLRWLQGLLGGLVLLLIADIALGSLLNRFDNDDTGPTNDHVVFGFEPTAQEALATQPGSEEIMSHLTKAGIGNFDPFTGWRFGPGVTSESPVVNIVDGVRTTRTSAINGERAEVWFFGGSTLYGSGQSDMATIPSVVVALLDDADVPINAVKFRTSRLRQLATGAIAVPRIECRNPHPARCGGVLRRFQ